MANERNSDGTLGPREIGVLKTLMKFTLAMLLVPIFSYFVLKSYVIEAILGYENGAIGSAIVTVVIVHIIIGLYIWTAIVEERNDPSKVAMKTD